MNDEISAAPDVLCVGNSSGTRGISSRTATALWDVAQNGYSRPFVLNGTMYLADKPDLRAIDAVSGTVKWTNSLPFGPDYIIQAQGLVIGCGRYAITAVDEKTGAFKWLSSGKSAGEIQNALAFSEGKLFIERSGGELCALDIRTGKHLWTWNTPKIEQVDCPPGR